MARQRPPTDEQQTEIYDSQQGKRAPKPTKKGFESGESGAVEIGTPTEIDPPRQEPIRVISMKTPAEVAAEKKKKSAKLHKVEIRALADARKHSTPPRGMGYLAPPADPRKARARKLRDVVIWGSVLVIISCIVMLAVWFLAAKR